MKIYSGRELARILNAAQKLEERKVKMQEWGAVVAGAGLALLIIWALSFFSNVCLKAQCEQGPDIQTYGQQ